MMMLTGGEIKSMIARIRIFAIYQLYTNQYTRKNMATTSRTIKEQWLEMKH